VLHDLHHIVTGYGMDWAGEGEISAWEIATGCGRYGFAWFINLQGMVMGWVVAPRRTWRAWVRGRHSKSLYGEGWSEALLSERVADMRARLELDRPAPEPTLADRVSYTAWCSLAAAHAIVLLGIPIAGITALVRALF
jgi:ubiquinone biosynthesis protein Coq4